MAGGKGPVDRARALDELLLGSSRSPRGWAMNLALGLHPALFWLWAPASVVCFALAGAGLWGDGNWLRPLVAAVVLAAMAWTCRGLPARMPD